MQSFPLPIRVAAGLAATAVEQSRQLPNTLIGLPVTVASQAFQVSMRVQQQITELAIKGDEILADCQPVEDQPEWATFDEDEPGWQPHVVADEDHAEDTDSAGIVAEYEQLSLPQLRGKLRSLSEAELAELLSHERSHQARPEYLRMLSNRLDRLRATD